MTHTAAPPAPPSQQQQQTQHHHTQLMLAGSQLAGVRQNTYTHSKLCSELIIKIFANMATDVRSLAGF